MRGAFYAGIIGLSAILGEVGSLLPCTMRRIGVGQAPDGLIDPFIDIFGLAYQFGHSCEAQP